MPTIDMAMARSLRPGTWETLRNSVARSVAMNLAERDIVDTATNKASSVANTFSSWDNCMAEAYCKWPVIAVIVIGGLIIFSIVWCIIRCCCCGLSCCCSCCQCLKCCGNCCGCCDPPKGATKHLDDPYAAPAAHHGYRNEPPMKAPTETPFASTTTPFASTTTHAQPPQYAEFETTKRNSDALPQMPSWEESGSKKVMMDDSVEMQNLKTSGQQSGQQSGVMNAAALSHATNLAQSRNGGGYSKSGNSSGYMNQNDQGPESYSPIDQQGYSYNNSNNNGYSSTGNAGNGYSTPSNAGYGADQTYGAAGASRSNLGQYNNGQSHSTNDYNQCDGGYGNATSPTAQGYGARQSPGPRRTPAPQDDYGYAAPSRSPGPQSNNSYGYGQGPSRSPAPQTDYGYSRAPARSPAPQNDYAYGQSPSYAGQRTYSPAPDASGYGSRPAPQRQNYAEPPQSPITNNSGFDFNSGYARPQQSPAPQEAYPGYKSYNG